MAKYSLSSIFTLIQSRKVTFIARSRSIDEIMKVFPNFNDSNAEDFVLSNLLKLTDGDFAESILQWNMVCDIYGKMFCNINWYIKFAVEKDENGDDNLSEISFHPLEDDLKLLSGVMLRRNI